MIKSYQFVTSVYNCSGVSNKAFCLLDMLHFISFFHFSHNSASFEGSNMILYSLPRSFEIFTELRRTYRWITLFIHDEIPPAAYKDYEFIKIS